MPAETSGIAPRQRAYLTHADSRAEVKLTSVAVSILPATLAIANVVVALAVTRAEVGAD